MGMGLGAGSLEECGPVISTTSSSQVGHQEYRILEAKVESIAHPASDFEDGVDEEVEVAASCIHAAGSKADQDHLLT